MQALSDKLLTLLFIAGAAGLAIFCGWRGARPPNPLRGPRLIPWRWLMVLCTAAALFGAAHYLQLLRPYAAT